VLLFMKEYPIKEDMDIKVGGEDENSTPILI
jgi:hypothetical protein